MGCLSLVFASSEWRNMSTILIPFNIGDQILNSPEVLSQTGYLSKSQDQFNSSEVMSTNSNDRAFRTQRRPRFVVLTLVSCEFTAIGALIFSSPVEIRSVFLLKIYRGPGVVKGHTQLLD